MTGKCEPIDKHQKYDHMQSSELQNIILIINFLHNHIVGIDVFAGLLNIILILLISYILL